MTEATGGRVVLDLEAAGADEVVYAAALHTPDAVHAGRARLSLASGAVEWTAWEPPGAPGWLVELAHAFLRAEWRSRRGPDPAPWPRRINRWREPRG